MRTVVSRLTVASTAALLAVAAPRVGAQEMEVPVPVQAALFVKVVSFDRNAPAPAGRLRIAIVYQSGNRSSQDAANAMARELRRSESGDRQFEPVQIDLDRQSLASAVAQLAPFAAYVAPLRAVDVEQLATVLRDARIRSFTGVAAYVLAGIAVGVCIRSDRPKLLVNLAAARAGGADYQAEFLKLAEVVR